MSQKVHKYEPYYIAEPHPPQSPLQPTDADPQKHYPTIEPQNTATRIAVSLVRVVALASNKLATLAQAINKTQPTTPKRINSRRRQPLTYSSRSGTMFALKPALKPGFAWAIPPVMTPISARACSIVACGLRRAIT